MFKADLDGMHRREVIQDYVREADWDRRNTLSRAHKRRKIKVGAAAFASILGLLFSLTHVSQILVLLGIAR